MRRSILIVGFILFPHWAFPASSPAPIDAQTIIQHSVEANAEDWKATPGYDYCERDQQSNGGTKTYKVVMILGSPYRRLVAVDGKLLPPEEQSQEQQKQEATLVQRRDESEQEKAHRIDKYEEDRKRDQALMSQLTKAFDFAIVGERTLDGHSVYLLKATPRPAYQPPDLKTEVLKGMRGELWIDKQSFQWVKVQAQVIHPVSIEGFLAKVQPGTRFELEKAPVSDRIWLPRHFAMKSKAKILFLFSYKSAANEHYFDYHPAGSAPTASCKE